MIDQQIIEDAQKMILEQNKERIVEITANVIASGETPWNSWTRP